MTDQRISPEPIILKLDALPPSIQMKANFWSNWAYIALAHEREALAQRDRLSVQWQGPSPDASAMLHETNASLVAIVAVAFAVDALHAEVAPQIGRDPDARSGGGRQWAYVFNTFKFGIPAASKWQREFEWLVERRDHAVHFQGVLREVVPHPTVPTNVAQEHVEFSAEAATKAVDILVRLWRGLFAGVVDPAVEPWVRDRRHVFDAFQVEVGRRP